jgi:predicted  nucleic acid-binding Zn-ribbon protein
MAKGVKTGGRKKGTPNKSEIRLRQELEAARAKLGNVEKPLMALDLLQQVYRDQSHELTLRLQAATKAIPYETPALATHKHDASETLTKTAQMFQAAAQTLDEKVNGILIAVRSVPTEDAAGDAYH